MRRFKPCFFFLALYFILGTSLQTSVNAGDQLPPDCCKFFCEADFNFDLLDTDFASSDWKKSGIRHQSKSRTTPIRGLGLTKPTLDWNFDYQPAKAKKAVSVIALRKRGHICFRVNPASEPIWEKCDAPALFWSTGSLANLSILMRMAANEAGSLVSAWMIPPHHIPGRMLRIVNDLIWIR